MTDQTQTDQANLSKTGNTGTAQGSTGQAADANAGKAPDATTTQAQATQQAPATQDPAATVPPRQRAGTNKERQRLEAERVAREQQLQSRNRNEPRANEPRARELDPAHKPNSAPASDADQAPVEAQHGLHGRTGFDRELHANNIDRELERRSQQNEEGHTKNLERAEKAAEKTEDVGKLPPGMGKSRDALINTPVIDKNGNKTWKL